MTRLSRSLLAILGTINSVLFAYVAGRQEDPTLALAALGLALCSGVGLIALAAFTPRR